MKMEMLVHDFFEFQFFQNDNHPSHLDSASICPNLIDNSLNQDHRYKLKMSHRFEVFVLDGVLLQVNQYRFDHIHLLEL